MTDAAVIVVLLVVVMASVAAWRRPFVGLLAYLWLDFMRPHDMVVELRSFRPMLVLGTIMLTVTVWREGRHLFDVWKPLLPAAAVAASVALSALLSVDRGLSAGAVLQVAKMVALVWLLNTLVTDERHFRAVLWVLGLSLAVLGVGAIIQALDRGLLWQYSPDLAIQGPAGEGDGLFRDNNDLARVLALSVPLWWVLAASEGRVWSRVVAGAGLLVSVFAIECTFSRSGFLALVAGVATLSLSRQPRWSGLALFVATMAGLLALSPPPYLERVATIARPLADDSVQGRVDVWWDAAQMISRHPLHGQGPGTFRTGEGGEPAVRRSAHNIFIELLAEVGVLGLASYAWMLVATLLGLHRTRRAGRDSWGRTASLGLEAALLAYLTASMALSRPLLSPLFVLVGLSLAIERCARGGSRDAAAAETKSDKAQNCWTRDAQIV